MSNANKFSDPNKMSMGKAKRLIILKTDDYTSEENGIYASKSMSSQIEHDTRNNETANFNIKIQSKKNHIQKLSTKYAQQALNMSYESGNTQTNP